MSLINFFIPKYCIYCGKESENIICRNCLKEFQNYKLYSEERCERCFHKKIDGSCVFCSSRFIFYDSLMALYEYNFFTKRALLEWKYSGIADIYKIFLEDCVYIIKQINPDRIGFISSGKYGKNYRSFEVLEKLIKECSLKTNIPYSLDLIKIKKIKQSKNKQKERFFEVLFSFKLTKELKEINKYLLIEDLVTTGATSNEASRILKENGVKKVYVLSLFMEELQKESVWNQYQNQRRMIS